MRILLPIDAEEDRAIAAVDAVRSLPNAAESIKVTILNVQEKMEAVADEGGQVSSEDWYNETHFPSSVTLAAEQLQDDGITVEKRREHADPSKEIPKTADEIDADWIIMAGRKRSPVGKVLFGSVVQSVLLHTDIPVTVVSA